MKSISKIADCKIVETKGWTLHLFKDNSFRLLPPPAWTAELVELVANKTISHAAAKIVLETWQSETLNRIASGINKLREMGVLNPASSPQK